MTRKDMKTVMNNLFLECQKLREAGQKEYAHLDENAFENFEAVGRLLDMSREKVLMVYLLKHIFGIAAHVKGHKSQREDVRGRIKDGIVYLSLLAGMVADSDAGSSALDGLAMDEWVEMATEEANSV